MLALPNLTETPFRRIEASMSMRLDQLSLAEYEAVVPLDSALLARIPGDQSVFVALEIGSETGEDAEMHAFISLSFEEPSGPPQLPNRLYPGLIDEELLGEWSKSDIGSIEKELRVFQGTTGNLVVEGAFSVERDELPSQSLVASMIGLRTVAGEEQFLLSGAQFAVRGFPNDTISWYLKPGSNGREVSGQIIRQCVERFHSDSLSDAVHVLEARFNRVIRAESDIKAHATT